MQRMRFDYENAEVTRAGGRGAIGAAIASVQLEDLAHGSWRHLESHKPILTGEATA